MVPCHGMTLKRAEAANSRPDIRGRKEVCSKSKVERSSGATDAVPLWSTYSQDGSTSRPAFLLDGFVVPPFSKP